MKNLKLFKEVHAIHEGADTLGELNGMTLGQLERIADYANMITDRMKGGQELDSWMFSQITVALDNLNAVHDTMDGIDGVKESLTKFPLLSDFDKLAQKYKFDLIQHDEFTYEFSNRYGYSKDAEADKDALIKELKKIIPFIEDIEVEYLDKDNPESKTISIQVTHGAFKVGNYSKNLPNEFAESVRSKFTLPIESIKPRNTNLLSNDVNATVDTQIIFDKKAIHKMVGFDDKNGAKNNLKDMEAQIIKEIKKITKQLEKEYSKKLPNHDFSIHFTEDVLRMPELYPVSMGIRINIGDDSHLR